MHKLFAVLKREYLERVRKRSFIVLTLLGPLLIAGIYALPVIFLAVSGSEKHVAVVDLHGGLLDDFVELLRADGRLVSDDPDAGDEQQMSRLELARTRFRITDVREPGDTLESARQRLNQALAAETFDAYLIIGAEMDSEDGVLYGSRSSGEVAGALERALTRPVVAERARIAGVDLAPEQLIEMTETVAITPIRVNSSGVETSTSEEQQTAVLATVWVMAFFFYMIFLLWGSSILRSIIEEKSSRVMEVLLSSVSSTQFMVGKVAGIGAVAMTQIVVWGVCGLVLTLTGATAAPQIGELVSGIDPWLFVWFVVLFLLGFAMYAVIYAAVGSTVSSTQEAEQAAGPVTMLIIASFMAMFAVQQAPDSGLAVAVSLFPLTAPLNMLMRLGISDPPAWQIGLSLVFQVGAVFLLAWLAARVFRVGTLMYGKRATIPEIFKWMRQGAI